MKLEWRHAGYQNPRLHYLYRGNYYFGLVSMLGNHGGPIRGYSVYLRVPDDYGSSRHKFQCIMPTLEEAKMVLQTLAGAQL